MSLSDWIRGKRDFATATLATVATHGGENGRSVARVATVAVATPAKVENEDAMSLSESIEERAAIMEFDGGLSRMEAERAAVLDAREAPCKVCAHFHRPGLSDGYCHVNARPDLPLAYGENHPLRQLPDDMGAACKAFQPNWRMSK